MADFIRAGHAELAERTSRAIPIEDQKYLQAEYVLLLQRAELIEYHSSGHVSTIRFASVEDAELASWIREQLLFIRPLRASDYLGY